MLGRILGAAGKGLGMASGAASGLWSNPTAKRAIIGAGVGTLAANTTGMTAGDTFAGAGLGAAAGLGMGYANRAIAARGNFTGLANRALGRVRVGANRVIRGGATGRVRNAARNVRARAYSAKRFIGKNEAAVNKYGAMALSGLGMASAGAIGGVALASNRRRDIRNMAGASTPYMIASPGFSNLLQR